MDGVRKAYKMLVGKRGRNRPLEEDVMKMSL